MGLDLLIDNVNRNKKNNIYNLVYRRKTPKTYFISVIIPVRGRTHLLPTNIKHLKDAIEKTDKKINITIVEHSYESEIKNLAKEMGLTYYFIKCEKDEVFNKSIAQNVGAIINKNSEYLMFHDLDCLVLSDFFVNIINELSNKNNLILQNFRERRLLYLNERLTSKIINGECKLSEINLESNEVVKGDTQAPGGSITVQKKLFFNVGGFDPELFYGHAPEDTFFWKKIETITQIDSSENEMFHMYHQSLEGTNPLFSLMFNYYETFLSLPKEKKLEFIDFKSKLILKFI
jgi:predicted glycosyltransferase involved in capsule biosynthesis